MKKKSKIKVSVIVPVYNSEQYVKKTLLSILKQDFKDFEVLAIDDGSSDKSGKICDKLSKKYKNLRVYHTKNHGVCHARNIGIKKARGEYIAFCDNDDEFLPDLLKEVYMASKLDKQKARYNESQRASKHKSQK
ncbi:MAG: glycosyltransferase family 2 protein, partial [Coriobacteriales bacterium]|nr:glycosyltransferase family 2 protein [Coriobacteriales bacterium]